MSYKYDAKRGKLASNIRYATDEAEKHEARVNLALLALARRADKILETHVLNKSQSDLVFKLIHDVDALIEGELR